MFACVCVYTEHKVSKHLYILYPVYITVKINPQTSDLHKRHLFITQIIGPMWINKLALLGILTHELRQNFLWNNKFQQLFFLVRIFSLGYLNNFSKNHWICSDKIIENFGLPVERKFQNKVGLLNMSQLPIKWETSCLLAFWRQSSGRNWYYSIVVAYDKLFLTKFETGSSEPSFQLGLNFTL